MILNENYILLFGNLVEQYFEDTVDLMQKIGNNEEKEK
jgi:hypothetical protein